MLLAFGKHSEKETKLILFLIFPKNLLCTDSIRNKFVAHNLNNSQRRHVFSCWHKNNESYKVRLSLHQISHACLHQFIS
jgi:hypothetical protein